MGLKDLDFKGINYAVIACRQWCFRTQVHGRHRDIFCLVLFFLLLIYYQTSQMWLGHIMLFCETVNNILLAFLFLQSFPSCLDIVLQAQVCIWNYFVHFSFHVVLFAATFAVWFMFFSYVHHHMNGSLIVSGSAIFYFLMFDLHNVIWN